MKNVPKNIIVNSVPVVFERKIISYNDISKIAGTPDTDLLIFFQTPSQSNNKGAIVPGESVVVIEGMIFDTKIDDN